MLFIDNVPGDDQTSLYFVGFLNTWIAISMENMFSYK
jgi:hypothetical protein